LRAFAAGGVRRSGRIEAALASIIRAIAETERTSQRWNEADTDRVRGEFCSSVIRRN
jgi:hypothetical protein